jgi:Ca2+/H+ antiporter
MAENQSLHRQHLEKWAVIGGTILSYFGVACALIIALFTIYSGSNLIYKGNVVSGSIFAGIGLLGLVSAFIYGTRSRREERLRRDQLNKELIYRK